MSRRLDQDFGRYDTDFTSSDAYLCMPEKVRNDAYLFLLALSGWSRRRLEDGSIAPNVARAIARQMGVRYPAVLEALVGVGLVDASGDKLFLTRYSKWQETREEVEDRRRQAREAGRIGGLRSAAVRSGGSSGRLTSGSSEQQADPVKRIQPEKRREEKREHTPLTPLGGETLLRGCEELMGRTLSGAEVRAAERLAVEAPRLTPEAALERMAERKSWLAKHGKPPYRTLDPYVRSAIEEDHYLADQGVTRPREDSGGGFERMGAGTSRAKGSQDV